MYQCLGLGTVEDGGCGEDWWHTGCIVGLGPDWEASEKVLGAQEEEGAEGEAKHAEDSVPPGFPEEIDFDVFVCYKCVESNPWIKKYAGSKAALPPVFNQPRSKAEAADTQASADPTPINKKRKAEDDIVLETESPKRMKSDSEIGDDTTSTTQPHPTPPIRRPLHTTLATAPEGQFSLFLRDNFRDHLCRCAECFPALSAHPQLLEEEDSYEPSRSESSDEEGAGSSVGTRSLLDRGEKALNNVDRVRAIGKSLFAQQLSSLFGFRADARL